MAKRDAIRVDAKVLEALPNAVFKVALDTAFAAKTGIKLSHDAAG